MFAEEAKLKVDDKDNLYHEEDIKHLATVFKEATKTSNVPTFHHWRNVQQVTKFFLIFYRQSALVDKIYSKEIMLEEWNKNFMKSCMLRKVNNLSKIMFF